MNRGDAKTQRAKEMKRIVYDFPNLSAPPRLSGSIDLKK